MIVHKIIIIITISSKIFPLNNIRVLCHTLINAEQVKCTLYTNYIYYAKPYSAIKTTMKNR